MNKLPMILLVLSIFFAALAGAVSVFQWEGLWLAGTQWMMIAIIVGIFAVYASVTKKN